MYHQAAKREFALDGLASSNSSIQQIKSSAVHVLQEFATPGSVVDIGYIAKWTFIDMLFTEIRYHKQSTRIKVEDCGIPLYITTTTTIRSPLSLITLLYRFMMTSLSIIDNNPMT